MANVNESQVLAKQNETEVDNEVDNGTSEADKKLGNMINAAVSSHLKRHLSKFESSILELKESFAATQLDAKHSKATPSVESEKNKKNIVDDDSPAMREVERLKSELNAEKARVREEKAYTSLRNYLSDKVLPERVDVALKLFKADGKVQFRRDGSPFVKHDNEEFDLEEGAAEWLKSKEAMMFLPAPSAQKKSNTVQTKNLPFKTPAKVSTTTGQDQPTNPAAKTLLQLQKLGINF